MKKLLMLGAMAAILSSTTSAFASCHCQQIKKVECDPCEREKITCVQTCPTYNQAYQSQCCNKQSFFKRMWNGTRMVYDNSVGAIYDTVVYPFR
ncbi:hypothetical protein IJE86_08315 [bacterium]|nr:hypothetical protein [bacterium]